MERMTSTPAAFGPALLALLLPLREQVLPRARASSPFSSEGSFGSSCNKNVTQKRTQTRQAHDPHFCLSLAASCQERASNHCESHSPKKEKRHYEVCLERVFTRLAGVGLERLGEEARHRRLVIMIPRHNT